MSCPDCERRQRQHLLTRLNDAAKAHGYELWSREGVNGLEVMAVPTAASHGTPQALVDTFAEVTPGLPRAPRRGKPSVRPPRRNRHPEVGHVSYRIDGAPPIELVFKEESP